MSRNHHKAARAAFTLIELLIVVAIIAILAAIAVPNFLEAQMRSKVSRAKADMRTIATAMEAYRVDNNSYIYGNTYGVAGSRPGFVPPDPMVLERLSTPIAYLSTGLLPDPFVARRRSGSVIGYLSSPLKATQVDLNKWTETPKEGAVDHFLYRTYLYISTAPAQGSARSNLSGIMRVAYDDQSTRGIGANGYIMNSAGPMEAYVNAGGVIAGANRDRAVDLVYDPTNGTVSFGNIWRVGGSPGSTDNIYGAVQVQP